MGKITIVIPSLAPGGAERVCVTQSNYWANRGWQVNLITFSTGIESNFYQVDSHVDLIRLSFGDPSRNVLDSFSKNIYRNAALRKAIIDSSPVCIISHLISANIRTMIATLGLNIPVILTDHSPPGYAGFSPIENLLRTVLYPLGSAIVAPSQETLDSMPYVAATKAFRIPNPVALDVFENSSSNELLPSGKNIVGVGRLEKIKRFDLLIRAFAKVDKNIGAVLHIVGDGPMFNELISLARELGVGSRVIFPGFLKNPWRILKDADILVLSSEQECFPMVILESMTCGVPVVSFDCPVGPGQMITNGLDGLLIPVGDVDALATAMERLLLNDEKRIRLGIEAKKTSQKYAVASVMSQWDDLIEQIISSKRDKRSIFHRKK